MDRVSVYRDQVPLETHILEPQRYAMEAFGLFGRDLIGDGPAVAGFACVPTSPASMSVLVRPGRHYQLDVLDAEDWGKLFGQGGMDADVLTDHKILKQGLLRGTVQFDLTAPGTAGQTIIYLVQSLYSETDDADSSQQFWNSTNPNAPRSEPISTNRRAKATLSLKAGAAAATGSATAPAVDAGKVPLWLIAVAYGATSITAPNITAHPSQPTIAIGSGGGGGGGGAALSPWQVVAADITAVSGGRYIVNPTGSGLDVNLPASPAPSDEVWIKGKFVTHNITVHRNGQTIEGVADDLVLNKDFQTVHMVFDGATWRV
jgi:hypothetical protein